MLPAQDAVGADEEDRPPYADAGAATPYALAISRPSSASSGIRSPYVRANDSWLSTPCGLMPQTSASSPSKVSMPEEYEHSCFVQTVVLSPG